MNRSGPLQSCEPVTFIIRPESYVEQLRLEQLFGVRQPIEVELGSGDGSFLAAYAKAHAEKNFLGVERLLGRIRKLDRKAVRNGLKNIRLLRLEASYLMEHMLPDSSIEAFHVYFPDPWPKRRHRKNRLINEHFTKIADRKLISRGLVYLRTDNEDYFQQMQQVFGENKNFEQVESPAELLSFITDFERGFNAKGIKTLHSAWRKKS